MCGVVTAIGDVSAALALVAHRGVRPADGCGRPAEAAAQDRRGGEGPRGVEQDAGG